MTRGAHFTPGIRGQTVELLQTDKQRSNELGRREWGWEREGYDN